MRVVLVAHGYPPYGLAGVERQSEQTACALTKRGHSVTVFARRPSAAPPEPRLERYRSGDVDVMVVSGAASKRDVFESDAAVEQLFERCVIEARPDVVLISHLMHHSPLYVLLAHRWGVPVMVELHDFFFACPRAHLERVDGGQCGGPEGGRSCAHYCYAQDETSERAMALRTHLFRRALTEADAVVCPSNLVADYFTQDMGIRRSYEILANGVDIQASARAKTSGQTLRLGSVSVLVPHKGIHVVLEALDRANLASAEYTVFGAVTEPYLRQLITLAQAVPGLTFNVYGSFEPSLLPELLCQVDALVVPSLVRETYSIVAREAFACGIPVIASRIGALPGAVREGENGYLFDPGRPEALAAILQMLGEDRTRLERLRTGIKRSDWMSADERCERLETIIDKTVDCDIDMRGAVVELDNMRALREAHQHSAAIRGVRD